MNKEKVESAIGILEPTIERLAELLTPEELMLIMLTTSIQLMKHAGIKKHKVIEAIVQRVGESYR